MTDQTDAPNTHTILVIDDDPDIRRLLRIALEEAGYDAREGDDGLAIAKQEQCSLAIVDLLMPGKERYDMYRRNTDFSVTQRATRSAGLFIGAGLLAACAAASPGTTPLQTHYIQIQDAVSPQHLNVHVGDEVRWQNLRNEPVRISLLSQLSGSGISCQTGFSRFGSLDDTTTIPPNAYVSLCFARTGSIQYNVWLKLEEPLRSMTPTAKIIVSARPT